MNQETIKLPSVDTLKREAHALKDEAAELAEQKILRPARRLARDACDAVSDGSECTQEMLRVQGRRTSDWIAQNPFAAVGIALGAGLLLSSLLRSRR